MSKGDIVILSAVLAENRIGNAAIWNTLQEDLMKMLEKERMSAHLDIETFSGDFSSFAHVLDCIYKSTSHVHEGMINKIGFECL